MRPVIGINCTFEDQNSIFNNRVRLDRIYVQAVERMGGVPLLLPIVDQYEVIEEMMGKVDGLLMSGGGGLSTAWADPNNLPDLRTQSPVRHDFDVHLVRLALERDLPLLGICRGHQTINDVAGGSLHLSLIGLTEKDHRQTLPDDRASHMVRLERNSRLAALLGTQESGVNSFHRQAVDQLAPGFRAVAWAEDGILEGYESLEHSFVLGCQFHPESLMVTDNRFASIYGALIEAARSFQQHRRKQ